MSSHTGFRRASVRRIVLGHFMVCALTACSPAAAPGAMQVPDVAGTLVPWAGTPIDLGAIARPVTPGFRPAALGWTATGATWTVATSAAEVTFTPVLMAVTDDHGNPRHATPGRVHTQAISGVPVGNAALVAQPDGSLAVTRGQVIERWRTGDDGAEQTWTFAQPPAGGGAVTVRVVVEGLVYRGETAGGLHFADSAGVGFRYGRAAWVDANGLRTAVSMRWDGAAVELSVPAEVTAHTAFPAVLDPMVSPEIGLDVAVHASPRLTARRPRIAFNGSMYMVVWADSSRDPRADIWGARFTPAGAILDPYGIPIFEAPSTEGLPDVASAGGTFLVAWRSIPATGAPQVYAVRVDGGGHVLDASPWSVGAGIVDVTGSPAVASNGTTWLVAYPTSSASVGCRRYTTSGAALDPVTVPVTSGVINPHDVAANGTARGWTVAWDQGTAGGSSDIEVARLALDGSLLAPGPQTVTLAAAGRILPALASDGTNTLVVWNATAGAGARSSGIYATLLAPDGGRIGPTVNYFGPANASTATGPVPIAPSVVFDGTHYVVAWANAAGPPAETLYTSRVDTAGTLVDATPRSLVVSPAGPVSSLELAPGSPLQMVWGGGPYAFGVGVRDDGTALSAPISVTTQASTQTAPRVAADGTGFLALWNDAADGAVHATRISAAGVIADAPPLNVASPSLARTSLAFANGAYVAAYNEPPSAVAVDPSGRTIGSAFALPLSPPASYYGLDYPFLGLSAGRGALMMIWPSATPSPSRDQINLTRIGTDGRALDPTPTVLQNDLDIQSYALAVVAGNPAGALAAWTTGRDYYTTHDSYSFRVRVTRTDVAGDLINGSPVDVMFSSTRAAVALGAASNGADYLVAWQDTSGSPSAVDPPAGNGGIYAARVSASRGVLDPTPIQVSGLGVGQSEITVAWDGSTYVLAWVDTTRGNGDIVGARVSTEGTVLDPAGILLASDPVAIEDSPHLAANPDGHAMLVYRHRDDTLHTERVFARAVVYGTGVALDAGVPDAGVLDAGTRDAGVTDVGTADAGIHDTGTLDSELSVDVVVATDLGLVDAWAPDAVALDVLAVADVAEGGGVTDGTAGTDGGVAGDGTTPTDTDLADAGSDGGADGSAMRDVHVGAADAGNGTPDQDAGASDVTGSADATPEAGVMPPAGGGGGLCDARPGDNGRSGSVAWATAALAGLCVARRRRVGRSHHGEPVRA